MVRCKACSACLICRAVRHIVLNAKVIVQITDGRLSLPAVIHLRQTILLFCRGTQKSGIVHAERLENFFSENPQSACRLPPQSPHLRHPPTFHNSRTGPADTEAGLFQDGLQILLYIDRSAVSSLKSVDHLLKSASVCRPVSSRSAVRQPGCHIHNILQKDLPLRFFYLPIRCTYNRVPEARQILC